MSEIELVFRRAEFRCSGSLFRCPYLKLYFIQICNQYFWIKKLIHARLSIRIYLLELNYLFEGVKDVKHSMVKCVLRTII